MNPNPRSTTTSQVPASYQGNRGRISSLRIRESSIELRDILELCTPLPNTHGGSKIIGTIQHIVSQLSGSFDLQSKSTETTSRIVIY
jgi:hypothetical protein